MAGKRLLKLTVNGREREDAVADNMLLLDYLRDSVGLTGTKRGCDGGECGACTVLIDGQPRLSCITLAASCEGRTIETIECLAAEGRMSRLQHAFHEKLGTQCGFCTPGMIMAPKRCCARNPAPSESEIREALSGNLCRCTGYVKIVESVQAAFAAEASAARRAERCPVVGQRHAADRRHREGHRSRTLHRRPAVRRCARRAHPAQPDRAWRHPRHRHQQGARACPACGRSSPARTSARRMA